MRALLVANRYVGDALSKVAHALGVEPSLLCRAPAPVAAPVAPKPAPQPTAGADRADAANRAEVGRGDHRRLGPTLSLVVLAFPFRYNKEINEAGDFFPTAAIAGWR